MTERDTPGTERPEPGADIVPPAPEQTPPGKPERTETEEIEEEGEPFGDNFV